MNRAIHNSLLQITDEDGNAIPLSIQDARQLLTQGQFISHLPNGQTIRIHSGVCAQEFLNSAENQDFVDKNDDNFITYKSIKDITAESSVQADADAIVKVLEVRIHEFHSFVPFNEKNIN